MTIIRRFPRMGLALMLAAGLAIFGLNPQPASADTFNLTILESSCSGATVQFYFDGLTTGNNPAPITDKFRLYAQNVTVNAWLGQIFQDVAVEGQNANITMSLTWPTQPNGSRIQLWVTQFDQNNAVVNVNGDGLRVEYDCIEFVPPTDTPEPTFTPEPTETPLPDPTDIPPPTNTPEATNTPAPIPPTFTPLPPTPAYTPLYFGCLANGLMVYNSLGVEMLRVNTPQVSTALYTALTTRTNQLVASGNGISLWALWTNELQTHYNNDPWNTRIIVISSICGVVPPPYYPPPYYPPPYTPPPVFRAVYIVQRGDTLWRISRAFGTTINAIAQANGIRNVNLIYVGQRLLIP